MPVIDGSMLELLGNSDPVLAVDSQIRAALSDRSVVVGVVTAADGSIGETFAALSILRAQIQATVADAEVQSLDDVRAQLFVWNLDENAPLVALLNVLSQSDQSRFLVNTGDSQFLVVIRAPRSAEPALTRLLTQFGDPAFAQLDALSEARLAQDVTASLKRDLTVLVPLIVLSMLAVLWFAFRESTALLLPFFASVASATVLFALFSVLGVSINLVTLLAFPIVLIVGLANSCHFLAKSVAVQVDTDDIDAAVEAAVVRVGPPFFVSSLTTSIALASLSLNELGPIADLGCISALALMLAFLLIMLAAPLSLRWYLSRPSRWQGADWPFAPVSLWLSRHRRSVVVTLSLLSLAGVFSATQLNVHSDPRAFFPDDGSFRKSLNQFERNFYLFAPLRVLVSGREAVADHTMEALSLAGEIRASLSNVPGVRAALLEGTNDGGAGFVITALLVDDSVIADAAAVIGDVEAAHNPDAMGVSVRYSSATLAYRSIDQQAMRSLLLGFVGSVLLIFGAVALVFRSLRSVLGAVASTAIPLLLVCAAVYVTGLTLNLVTVFVFLVALGVIVDDAIHILFWRQAGDPLSGSSIEFSVFFSTALLCLGLSLCLISHFETTREFAVLCAVALMTAVVSNLTVLPALLRPVAPVAPIAPAAGETRRD